MPAGSRRRLEGVRRSLDRARLEVAALAVAARDPRTPWYAKLVCGLTVGLAVSPVDTIPDVVPVLAYLDDLVFVPLGVYAAWQLTPPAVRESARSRAGETAPLGAAGWLVAGLVVLAWLAVGVVSARWLLGWG